MINKKYYLIFTFTAVLVLCNFFLIHKKNQQINLLGKELSQAKYQQEFLHAKISKFKSQTKNIYQTHQHIKKILKNINTSYIQNFDPYNKNYAQAVFVPKNLTTNKQAIFAQEQELELLNIQSASLLADSLYKNFLLNTIPSLQPALGYISSPLGIRYHPILGIYRGHQGIDIAATTGTPVYAPARGVIRSAHFSRSLGLLIEINHNFDLRSRFGHLSKLYVRRGQHIERGQIIGLVGNTGEQSEGPHLHYEIRHTNRILNPENFILTQPKNNSEIF